MYIISVRQSTPPRSPPYNALDRLDRQQAALILCLIEAIHKVAAGETAFSPEIESMIARDPHPPELTERQQKILEATSKGLSSERIAAHLGISAYAVNQHPDAIRRKLGAQSRTEAVAIALRKQFLKI